MATSTWLLLATSAGSSALDLLRRTAKLSTPSSLRAAGLASTKAWCLRRLITKSGLLRRKTLASSGSLANLSKSADRTRDQSSHKIGIGESSKRSGWVSLLIRIYLNRCADSGQYGGRSNIMLRSLRHVRVDPRRGPMSSFMEVGPVLVTSQGIITAPPLAATLQVLQADRA